MPDKLKLTLLTNINFVQQKHLRLECHALLIQANWPGMFTGEITHNIRGFGTTGDALIFTQWLDSGSFSIKSADSQRTALFVSHDGNAKPLFTGGILNIDGIEYFLQIEDSNFPLDELDVTGIGYPALWENLERKVEQYWKAPNMPRNSWGPPRRRTAV
jgi:hypothetical protein